MDDDKELIFVERDELQNKISKLDDFILSDSFKAVDYEDRFLIMQQKIFMSSYFDILNDRIKRF